jgi:DNA-binding FadR family transcriptional regulator
MARIGQNQNELLDVIDAIRAIGEAEGSLPAERTLADRLNVKRHRLRRALQELRANGEFGARNERRGGARVRHGEALVQDTNPLEVIELRMMLEPGLARLAAVRATPLDIARIQRLSRTAPHADSGATDLAFHKAIASSARNRLAHELYALLRRVGSDARLKLANNRPACPNRVAQRDLEHQAIVEAILERDPDGAERAMLAHLIEVQRRILAYMAPVGAAGTLAPALSA